MTKERVLRLVPPCGVFAAMCAATTGLASEPVERTCGRTVRLVQELYLVPLAVGNVEVRLETDAFVASEGPR